MIGKDDVEKSFEHLINSLERVENPSEILSSIEDLQNLTLTIGYVRKDSTFFTIGDALSTLSYHLKHIYSKYIPGLVPKEILTAATSKVKESLDHAKDCLKIIRKELFKKDDPDYKILLDNIGKIYIFAYDLFRFEATQIIPPGGPSEE